MTLAEIENILLREMPGTVSPILTAVEASARAVMIFEDMAALRFALSLEYWRVPLRGVPPFAVSCYPIPGTSFTLEPNPNTEDVYMAMGPGLSHGAYIKLSKACSLGRQHLKKAWPQQYSRRLRNGDDHLGVIEEVLWLGTWTNIRHVSKSYVQNSLSGKDIDFRFQCGRWIINLEAKYRWRDWMAKVDGPSFSRDFDSYFSDVEGKFITAPQGELNIVAITTLAQVDHSLRDCVWRYLREHKEINAVIVRSYDAGQVNSSKVFSLDHALIAELETLFKVDSEENFYVHPFTHLGRNSDNRRVLRPGEFEPLSRPRLLDVQLIVPAYDDSWIPRNK